jgi:hypothetical protein
LLASIPALLLFPVWNKIFSGKPGLAVLSTFLNWLWVVVVFISAVVLWQRKESRFFGPTSYIISLSTALSGFWLLVFYPAVLSVDSLALWQGALNNRYSNWQPPLLAMLMHATQSLAKTPSLFSFIQGALFWGALFYLIRQVAQGHRLFLVSSTLVVLLPPLWLHSNAIVSTTWGAVVLMLAMAFLIQSIKGQREISFYLSVLSLSVAVMFRQEAVLCAVVPIVTYLLFLKQKGGLAKKALVIAITITLTIVPGRMIEFSPNVMRLSGSRIHGLFNQYVGTVVHSMRLMSREDIDKERQSIDREFGKGVFRKLIRRYDCRAADYIIFNRHYPRVLKRIPKEKNLFILKKVIQMTIRHPGGYLKHQVCHFGQLSQFSGIAYQSWGVLEKEPHYEARRTQLGIPYNTQIPSIKAGYVKLMNASLRNPVFSLIYRHYIFLLFSVIFLGLGFFAGKKEWIIPSFFSLVIAAVYLLTGPAGLWRYLLPSYLGAWVCLPAVLSSIFRPGKPDR